MGVAISGYIWAVLALMLAFNVDVTALMPGTRYHRSSGYFSLDDDPPRSTPVSLPAKDLFNKRITAQRNVGLVLLDSCSTCSAKSVRREKLAQDVRLPLVFVFYDSPANVAKLMKDKVRTCDFVLADPKMELAKRMNAVWLPRIYILDKDLCLVECQQNPDDRIWTRYQ